LKNIYFVEDQKMELEKLSRAHNTQQKIAIRSNIILMTESGFSPTSIAKKLQICRDKVYCWIERWSIGSNSGIEVSEILNDEERLGAPGSFTPEQACQLFAMACEKPNNYGRPISHWTSRELANEMIKQGFVKSISPRHVGRLLAEADIKPHKMKYYLHTEKDEHFDACVSNINNLYKNAQKISEEGGLVISNDEKTGIQALERIAPDKLMEPGRVERHEFNYERHGTLSLIANLNVATGEIIYSSLKPTRTEFDFADNIKNMILASPSIENWQIICDNLNTHQSESLVLFVAEKNGIDKNSLGEKGKSGILKSQESRKIFLMDKNHNIVFHYTPKHASWMNQIEIWFSILVRKLLKRESFNSLESLRLKIIEFIKYFNKTMAKPFKWTYKGRVLSA
jgi:transposase